MESQEPKTAINQHWAEFSVETKGKISKLAFDDSRGNSSTQQKTTRTVSQWSAPPPHSRQAFSGSQAPNQNSVRSSRRKRVPFQLLHRNAQRFRGGVVFKAHTHRLLYRSTLGSSVMKKKKSTVPEEYSSPKDSSTSIRAPSRSPVPAPPGVPSPLPLLPLYGCRVQDSGIRVQGSGFRVQGSVSGFRVQGSGFRVQGSGFRVQGSGLRLLHMHLIRRESQQPLPRKKPPVH